MKTKTTISYFLLFLLFFNLSLLTRGQDVKIETSSLEIVHKRLEITYNITKSKKTHRFEVWVEISTLSGVKIDARTFSGDVGSGLIGGKNKKIVWDYNADGIILNEEVDVDVKAIKSAVTGAVKPVKELAKSLVLPGWGLSSMDKNKPYWLLGVVGYASLGTSWYLASNYQKNYDKYKETVDPIESTNLFNKSRNQKSLAQVFTYTAIGTWVISAVWTIAKANKLNSSLAVNRKEKKLLFYSSFDPFTKTSGFTVKYNF